MTLALPTSYRVLGAVPLGEGVVDKPTKRRESALLAGAIRRATWLGSEGGGKGFSPRFSQQAVLRYPFCGLKRRPQRLLQNNLSRFKFLHTVKQTLYKQIK